MVNNKNALTKILDHPDKEEIISKLILGISAKDIHEWLENKYSNVSEAKFVVAEKSLKSFNDNYLDIYDYIKNDLVKAKQSIVSSTQDDLVLSVQDNPTYKSRMLELAGNEIDIKKMLVRMIANIETRAAQVFDSIQENPRDISRNDRILIEWFDLLGSNLERFSKIVLGAPDQVIQHNVTVQHIDQHVQLFQEAVRETLAEIDIETSMYFMDKITEKFNRLKPPSEREQNTEVRLAEAKILNETINKKLNENPDGK